MLMDLSLSKTTCYLTEVEFEYSIATSDSDIYFLAANLRQDIMSDRETMTHTCLQKLFSVIACKARLEKIHGALSNKAAVNH